LSATQQFQLFKTDLGRAVMTELEWREEADYIRGTATRQEFERFSNDPECFKRYVHMQAAAATEDGFALIACDMRLALNLVPFANPFLGGACGGLV
jgi:hypothetical protein